MGTLAGMDRMEGVAVRHVQEFEDAGPHLTDPERLRALAGRDGFLFVRGLVRADLVAALRARVLDHARRIGWLEPQAPIADARAAPGKRVGHHQDPDWVALQVDVQGRSEMWAVGDCVAIHRVLHALEGRSSYLNLSTANTCRVCSPHPDMATQPHQDAHYVRMIGEFWTVWIPLGDCPRSLGPLALLAGSHHGGLREHAGQGIVEGGVAVPAEAVWSTTDFRCGDAVLFRPHTVHCSLPNRSGDRLRLSVDFRYGFWDAASGVDWRASAIRPGPTVPFAL
jgi:ectoine hydroxylase-related dioxygenase (phytanoyl-CoA dioxygenase family)